MGKSNTWTYRTELCWPESASSTALRILHEAFSTLTQKKTPKPALSPGLESDHLSHGTWETTWSLEVFHQRKAFFWRNYQISKFHWFLSPRLRLWSNQCSRPCLLVERPWHRWRHSWRRQWWHVGSSETLQMWTATRNALVCVYVVKSPYEVWWSLLKFRIFRPPEGGSKTSFPHD